jgi:hypothetical protein
MSHEPKSVTDELGRQSHPEPPQHTSAPPPPSLLLYTSLLLFALILLVFAFGLDTYDWGGLLLNLATEIIGAIIILVLVERRLRSSDIHILQGLPEAARHVMVDWFSGDAKFITAYAIVLKDRVETVARPYYLHRPELEEKVLENVKGGLAIVGSPGSGKTTLVHFMVREQVENVLERPHEAHVPVLVSIPQWQEGTTVDVLRATLQSYYKVPDRTLYRLLKQGRLMCFFDDLDERFAIEEVIEKLVQFRQRYPKNPVILATRPLDRTVMEGLVHIDIPPLTPTEVRDLRRLRQRYAGAGTRES